MTAQLRNALAAGETVTFHGEHSTVNEVTTISSCRIDPPSSSRPTRNSR